MYIRWNISVLLCLIMLGTLKTCLGTPVKHWKEDETPLKFSFDVPLRNKKSSGLISEYYSYATRTFLSADGKQSAAAKNTNSIDVIKSDITLKLLEGNTVTNQLEENNKKKFSGFSPSDNILSDNKFSMLNCPDVHQLCQQRRAIMHFQCSCHKECGIYGECCSDVPYNNNSKKFDQNTECINYKGTLDSPGYYMVSKCPNGWENQNTKLLCEEISIFELDPLCYVPVTSNATKFTYRNIFCAVCNSDNNIVAWEVPKTCGVVSNPFSFSAKCRRDFKPPHVVERPRICPWNTISSCSNESASEDIKRKCTYYYEPIKLLDENGAELMYRNKFCAICNGVEEDELVCPGVKDFVPTQSTAYMPLATLIDVNFSEGGTAVGKMIRCEPGYIFDPWMEECRSVFCGRLYEYKDGKCIKLSVSNGNAQNLQYNSTLDSDCFKVSINSSDYVLQDNGTVIVLISGDTLRPGEYEALQNDSILVCTSESANYIEKFSDAQNYVTITCIAISMCCLLAKIILFFALPEPRKVPTLVVIFLSVSLFIAQCLLLAAPNQSGNALCVCIAVALHFFTLASVFWTNVLAFDIWRTFSTMKKNIGYNNNNLIYYTLYSWGTPLLIVFIGSIMEWSFPQSQFRPEYGHYVCWISNRIALLLYFALPLAVILAVNIIFFTMTAVTIAKTSKAAKFARQSTGENNHIKFALYVKLALVMGLTWLFGFISTYTENTVMWYLFTVFNGLQGAYILLAFSHFKRRSLKTTTDNKSTGSGTKSSLTNSRTSTNKD